MADTYIGQRRRLMSVQAFSEAYGPMRTHIYRLISTGELVAVKNGRQTLITVESAERWAANLPRLVSRAAPSGAAEAQEG